MEEQLAQTFLLIAAAFVAVAILARLRLSPVLGYLAAGLLLGPHGIGAVTDSEGTHFFGELGIALLMFVIGLEFSVPRLLSSGGAMIGLGFGTVAGATLLAGAASHFLVGLPLLPAALLGGAIAMSSTAIIQKHLVDTDAVSSRHGVAATGIVLFEDLVALILLSLIAALPDAANEVEMEKVLLRMGVSFVALAGVALLARRTLGRLLGWVARSGPDETFLLGVLTLVVGASLAAEKIGLSLPIGAFVVGMMVGESDFRHQLEEEIRPFRDLLLGVFFVTIGMSVDWSQILAQPAVTFLVLAAILVVKFLVVFGVTRLSGLPASSAVKTGLLLAHSGELGLLIVGRSLDSALLSPAIGQPVLGAIAASMLVGPILAQWSDRAGDLILRSRDPRGAEIETAVRTTSQELKGHVVLAGCGPVGRLVALTLEASEIPYLAIERNVERLRRAQQDGHKAVFGDASRAGILKAAGVDRAAAIIVLVNNWHRSVRIIREAKRLNPAIHVIASLRDDAHLGELAQAGAAHVFPENYAAGLGLGAQALMTLGMSADDATDRIRAMRAQLSPDLQIVPR
ncbi:sodium/hydrogen exchanger (plasmid) [Rhizorhabdus wittichii RW1]|jgi:monovalent cation:H+ antiporter-2, CPA2 family|uniref:Sodium/hydrogen exchanger n=1 Tax=Rhizorhabdus wittichii (strain DSM 6014 / CCUG 31198 / JCM 15750 / NBRC 105917 / EY 4224 / RW1) TaxID=392499 RepID=A0A9J9HGM0_RHIWR|nr:cation:proton antiporter [Rhizorhabdus sp.]ABQ71323.1 sodium/hydrogen exchanger [Rhizorhabdus wittichii RW1]MBD3761379.1 cation:proton antiporter [Rhizorhabdus sp.]